MQGSVGRISEEEVQAFARRCFRAGSLEQVAAEVEFLTVSEEDPLAPVDLGILQEIVGSLALHGRLLFEPGGQIELISPPATLPETRIAIDADLTVVRDALAARGIRLLGTGLDPIRPEHRVLHAPRYDAMEAFFDGDGLSGRIMMSRTAAIQVNLDFGEEPERRWKLAHRLGPVMAAAFSNSPLYCGAPSGWRSARLWTWRSIDRSRTSPVGGNGAADWARYALDARVMLIRRSPDDFMPVLDRTTFREWMTRGHRFGGPLLDDLAYHCTTLFPPIRPRGWLEIRMCDALPDPWWAIPIAVWTALLYDAEAGARAWRAAETVAGFWGEAAREGMSHPAIATAAREVFLAALDALPRIGASARESELTLMYFERWTARGRSPADEVLDAPSEVDFARAPTMGVEWT